MEELLNMDDAEFDHSLNALREQLANIEAWLSNPPVDASTEEIQEHLTDLEEYELWLSVYKEVSIQKTTPISTPPLKSKCQACEEGELNQVGHYGSCIDIDLDNIC